jgi:tetraacyldisaccharide 4'-kinase
LIKRLGNKKVTTKKFDAKIICIGNAIAGGAGKTPTAIAVYKKLQLEKQKAKICFVSTGFKAKLEGPVVVDAKQHNYLLVGDEALLLANNGNAIICKDRLKGVEFAVDQGFDHIILDDGLHDKRIHKDICFLVIDGNYGFGNGIVLPAGPLRDRLDFAITGTTHIILIGEDKKQSLDMVKKFSKQHYPVLRSYITQANEVDEKQTYVAFAGIGRPEKFFDMLKNDLKLNVAETVEYADHYMYVGSDVEYLNQIANEHKAKLITTEKDFVKLPEKFAQQVECLKIELKFEDREIERLLG